MRRLRGEKAEQEPTNDAAQVAGLSRILFLRLFLLAANES
jgi:hypothetical protein